MADISPESIPNAATIAWIVALFAALIAYNNYTVAKNKLRLDLFDKRFLVYQKLSEFYTAVFREGCVNESALRFVLEAQNMSRFLFKRDVQDHLERLWSVAIEMYTTRQKLNARDSLLEEGMRVALATEETNNLKWVMDQSKRRDELFRKYLHFE